MRGLSAVVRHVLFVAGFAVVAAGCGSTPTSPGGVTSLISTDLKAGTGAEATTGRTVTVHYTGWVRDTSKTDEKGTQFDTSVGKLPFSFQLGAGLVIKGWDQGVVGMKVGGIRRLVIPPSLGYGSQAVGAIPANATLIFDIELLGVV